MWDRNKFKSQIISSQKPNKQRAKTNRRRYEVDLIKLHGNIVAKKRQLRPVRYRWVKGIFFSVAVLCFFLLGYLIAALSMPVWAKGLIFIIVAILGLVSSYFVAALFHKY